MLLAAYDVAYEVDLLHPIFSNIILYTYIQNATFAIFIYFFKQFVRIRFDGRKKINTITYSRGVIIEILFSKTFRVIL